MSDENKNQWLDQDGLDTLLSKLRTKLDRLYIAPMSVEAKIELALLSSKEYTDKKINELKAKESTKLVNVEIVE